MDGSYPNQHRIGLVVANHSVILREIFECTAAHLQVRSMLHPSERGTIDRRYPEGRVNLAYLTRNVEMLELATVGMYAAMQSQG